MRISGRPSEKRYSPNESDFYNDEDYNNNDKEKNLKLASMVKNRSSFKGISNDNSVQRLSYGE